MTVAAIALAVGPLAMLAVPAGGAGSGSAGSGSEEAGAGNGYVLMIHGWFEPYPEGQPHAPGVISAIRDGDHITFSAIPYSVAAGHPEVVGEARLEIVERGTGTRHMYAPDVDSDNPVCRRETSFKGHEGPLAACPTFRMPAADFEGNVVLIALHFTGAGGPTVEPYNVANHTMLHGYLQAGVPKDLSVADRSGRPDPFLVEHEVDPVP